MRLLQKKNEPYKRIALPQKEEPVKAEPPSPTRAAFEEDVPTSSEPAPSLYSMGQGGKNWLVRPAALHPVPTNAYARPNRWQRRQ